MQKTVSEVFDEYDSLVKKMMKTGKEKTKNALVGHAMRKLGGKADPKAIGKFVDEKVKSL